MSSLIDRLGSRLLPALLTAAGATLLAAGLLTYTNPAAALDPSPSPAIVASPSASVTSPAPSASAGASSSASASPVAGAVATRIVIQGLDVDLPIVAGPDGYPYCNVAMYIRQLHQPGEDGAVYLYAHARTGMFLPLLEQSKVKNGRKMVGMLVQVYTSDDQLYLYEITKVLRHQTTLVDAQKAKTPQLWLQTSEGPNSTYPKLQVLAMPLSAGPADPAEAHPTPKPIDCG